LSHRDSIELASIALRAAQKAGSLAASGFRRPKKVEHKGELDLVTEFDIRCEELIRAMLSQDAPGVPIVGEEQGGQMGDDLTFFVDPIDGTTNYAHGHPFWCVSIGIATMSVAPPAGPAPFAGAVVAPALGAYWVGMAGTPSRRDGEPCRVSTTSNLKEALLATGFSYDRNGPHNNFAQFIAFKRGAQAVRRRGSAALDLCLVADGTYDGYWELKLSPWDAAAGLCIVQGAGGKFSDAAGAPTSVTGGQFVATNGLLHDDVLRILAETAQRPPL
jgi:myo-inositol-1(or 4)-monophosphatase